MFHVSKHGLQFFKMPAGGRVDDDGLVFSSTLNLSNAMAESFEPLPDLRGTQIHIQFVALDVSQGSLPSNHRDQRVPALVFEWNGLHL